MENGDDDKKSNENMRMSERKKDFIFSFSYDLPSIILDNFHLILRAALVVDFLFIRTMMMIMTA